MFKVFWAVTSVWVQWKGLSDLTIRRSLDELDRVELHGSAIVSPGLNVRIVYTSTIVFQGMVTKAENDLGSWKMEGYEKAVELRKQLVDYGGSYRNEWINLKAYQVIDNILAGSGWSRGVSSNIAPMQIVLPAVTIEYADRLKALSKVAKEMLKTNLWFDYEGKVYVTSTNTSRGVFSYSEKTEHVDATEVYDKVIVLGRGDGINQVMAEAGTGARVKAVVSKDIRTSTEAQVIANVLLEEYGNPKVRLEVTGNVVPVIQEADLVVVDGKTWMVYEAEHGLAETRLTCGAPSVQIGRLIEEKIRGLREIGVVAQGVTNVANFGGWQTAVSSTHAAFYHFFLPDESVGFIRVNEAYVNLYSSAYRIWSKGGAASATGTYAAPTQAITATSYPVPIKDTSYSTWVTIATLVVTVDTDLCFGFAQIDGEYNPSTGVYDYSVPSCKVRLYDATAGVVIATSVEYVRNLNTSSDHSAELACFGSHDCNGHTIELQVYIDKPAGTGTEECNVMGQLVVYKKHDHGLHSHPVEPGIYETDNYPSGVEVYCNGNLVADHSTYPAITSNRAFSATKIDIKDFVRPGENVIEVRSQSLGMVEIDGFYRIFIETKN